jgi:hypothetical protein
MTYNNLNRESYHDYIGRRLREENFGDEKKIDQRDNEIFDLKQRIRRLEEQVGSLLNHHE